MPPVEAAAGAQSNGAVGNLHRLAGMTQRHVAHFMTQYAFHFVVVHHVHQPRCKRGYSRWPLPRH
ncbi:Uncharacterised protein [Serratia odorifera]|uniref:Uncharacterized protein n=1 Tax=Serratia odorifera TaxID=618 RepID=A0A3S4FNY1_SEROD|nr:Uncharacterised protein [Serratia odorifera]